MPTLSRLRDAIVPPAAETGAAAQRHLDQLTKPPGSLGRLEELARRLVELRGGGAPAVARPVISAIISLTSRPFAMQWPWPRWVLVM